MANSVDPDQLEKPTDQDLHCFQKSDISRFSRTKVNKSLKNDVNKLRKLDAS